MKRAFTYLMLTIGLLLTTHLSWATLNADGAKALIKNTVDQVLQQPEKLNDSVWVDTLVDKVFDFERMSKFVLGRHWKTATPAQQVAFVKEFRSLLVRTYSTSLKKSIATGKTFSVNYDLPSAGSKDRPKIKTLVTESGKRPITVDYDMYFVNGVWKVYNVTVEGVSLVTNYQNEFDSDVRTIGMDGLIKKVFTQNQSAQVPPPPTQMP